MLAFVLAVAFLLGSLLGGQLFGKLKGQDLRQSGSGNLGATNALRAGGTVFGLAVLLFDVAKGIVAAILLPDLIDQAPHWLPWACAFAAILGHNFSPWAGFSGGKGAATCTGCYLALLPWGLLAGFIFFLSILLLTGYVSLGVLCASLIILLYVSCWSSFGIFSAAGAFAAATCALLIWSHRENLDRLIQGQENRFSKVMLIKPKS